MTMSPSVGNEPVLGIRSKETAVGWVVGSFHFSVPAEHQQ